MSIVQTGKITNMFPPALNLTGAMRCHLIILLTWEEIKSRINSVPGIPALPTVLAGLF
jgi:hypothetical protein